MRDPDPVELGTGVSEQDWADPIQIIARARAQGRQAEAFDPDRLILFIEGILIDRGLHPDRGGHHKNAQIAAAQLLRALAILPAGNYTSIDRPNAAYPDHA